MANEVPFPPTPDPDEPAASPQGGSPVGSAETRVPDQPARRPNPVRAAVVLAVVLGIVGLVASGGDIRVAALFSLFPLAYVGWVWALGAKDDPKIPLRRRRVACVLFWVGTGLFEMMGIVMLQSKPPDPQAEMGGWVLISMGAVFLIGDVPRLSWRIQGGFCYGFYALSIAWVTVRWHLNPFGGLGLFLFSLWALFFYQHIQKTRAAGGKRS
jgi:hypothetical protein